MDTVKDWTSLGWPRKASVPKQCPGPWIITRTPVPFSTTSGYRGEHGPGSLRLLSRAVR